MAGNSIGTAIPLITGAAGVFSLFHTNSIIDGSIDLLEIVIVLYPSYIFFVIYHQRSIKRLRSTLLQDLHVKEIETKLL